MTYKKKLKSNKKIKGGTIITSPDIEKFAAYVLADILMEYYVEIYIWCQHLYTESLRADIRGNYVNNFIRDYFDNFQNMHRRLIQSEIYTTPTTISDLSIDTFSNTIYNECKVLLYWYKPRLGLTYLDHTLNKYILDILLRLKSSNPTIVIVTSNSSLNTKLINLYALYCIAFFYKEDINRMRDLNTKFGMYHSDQSIPEDYTNSFFKLYDSLKKNFEKKNRDLMNSQPYFVGDHKDTNINSIIKQVHSLALHVNHKDLMAFFIDIYDVAKTKTKVEFVIRKLPDLISSFQTPYTDKGVTVFDELYNVTIHQTQQRLHTDNDYDITIPEYDNEEYDIQDFVDDRTLRPVTTQRPVRQSQSQIPPHILVLTYRTFLESLRYHGITTQIPHQLIPEFIDALNADIEQLASSEQPKDIQHVSNEKESIEQKIVYYQKLLTNPDFDSSTKRKIELIISDLKSRLNYLKLQATFNEKGISVLEQKRKNIESCSIKVGKDITVVYQDDDPEGNKTNEIECRSWNSEVHGNRLVKISKKEGNTGKHNCYDIYGLIDNLYSGANLFDPKLAIRDIYEQTMYTFDEFKSLFKTIYNHYSDYILEKNYEILFVLLILDDRKLKLLYDLVEKGHQKKVAEKIKELYDQYNFQYYPYEDDSGTYIPNKSYWYQNIQKVNRILRV